MRSILAVGVARHGLWRDGRTHMPGAAHVAPVGMAAIARHAPRHRLQRLPASLKPILSGTPRRAPYRVQVYKEREFEEFVGSHCTGNASMITIETV